MINTTRHFVFNFDIAEANQIINIDRELPSYVDSIESILCNVKSFETELISGVKFRNMTEISISLNSFKDHVVNMVISHEKNKKAKHAAETIIGAAINSSYSMKGYIKDNNVSNDGIKFNPYVLTIVLKTKIKCQ